MYAFAGKVGTCWAGAGAGCTTAAGIFSAGVVAQAE